MTHEIEREGNLATSKDIKKLSVTIPANDSFQGGIESMALQTSYKRYKTNNKLLDKARENLQRKEEEYEEVVAAIRHAPNANAKKKARQRKTTVVQDRKYLSKFVAKESGVEGDSFMDALLNQRDSFDSVYVGHGPPNEDSSHQKHNMPLSADDEQWFVCLTKGALEKCKQKTDKPVWIKVDRKWANANIKPKVLALARSAADGFVPLSFFDNAYEENALFSTTRRSGLSRVGPRRRCATLFAVMEN